MKTWTDEQLAILDSEYPTADLKELARRLDKTLSAVKTKALIRNLGALRESRFGIVRDLIN